MPDLARTVDRGLGDWDASYFVPDGIDREKWEAPARREAALGRRVQFHVHGAGARCDYGLRQNCECWVSRG